LQVGGCSVLTQPTLSTFNFRSLARAADTSQLRHHHHHLHCGGRRQYYHQSTSPHQRAAAAASSAHALHQQPCSDVTSADASAQV